LFDDLTRGLAPTERQTDRALNVRENGGPKTATACPCENATGRSQSQAGTNERLPIGGGVHGGLVTFTGTYGDLGDRLHT
jgi:hypothetical protein